MASCKIQESKRKARRSRIKTLSPKLCHHKSFYLDCQMRWRMTTFSSQESQNEGEMFSISVDEKSPLRIFRDSISTAK